MATVSATARSTHRHVSSCSNKNMTSTRSSTQKTCSASRLYAVSSNNRHQQSTPSYEQSTPTTSMKQTLSLSFALRARALKRQRCINRSIPTTSNWGKRDMVESHTKTKNNDKPSGQVENCFRRDCLRLQSRHTSTTHSPPTMATVLSTTRQTTTAHLEMSNHQKHVNISSSERTSPKFNDEVFPQSKRPIIQQQTMSLVKETAHLCGGVVLKNRIQRQAAPSPLSKLCEPTPPQPITTTHTAATNEGEGLAKKCPAMEKAPMSKRFGGMTFFDVVEIAAEKNSSMDIAHTSSHKRIIHSFFMKKLQHMFNNSSDKEALVSTLMEQCFSTNHQAENMTINTTTTKKE
eukprot:m.196325 g.196325  ORF g.196325 m.196325 type:complete len:347 (+) comp13675_c0_seq5:859-1899(+)